MLPFLGLIFSLRRLTPFVSYQGNYAIYLGHKKEKFNMVHKCKIISLIYNYKKAFYQNVRKFVPINLKIANFTHSLQ